MRDRWLGKLAGHVWDLEFMLINAWLRVRGVCRDCGYRKQVHPAWCPRQGGPGRRLWSQGG